MQSSFAGVEAGTAVVEVQDCMQRTVVKAEPARGRWARLQQEIGRMQGDEMKVVVWERGSRVGLWELGLRQSFCSALLSSSPSELRRPV